MGRPQSAKPYFSSLLEVVISVRTASALFPLGQDTIGSIIFLGNMPARVIGVVQPTQASRYDDQLFAAIPYTTFSYRLSGRSFFNSIYLSVNETFDEKIAVVAVSNFLRSWHERHDFDLFDIDEYRQRKQRVQKVLSLVTGFVAGVALLIAGIGVTNMMLVSVVERTREIGILMAIGARRLDIMLQFLVEAILLCVGGGVLGTLLAYALGETILYLGVPLTLEFSWRAIVAAILCSSVSGIAAGVLPARRAARINPVEALAR